MTCMKCGKDINDGQAFCARCLEGMEAYPVKPDVHIQLPARNKAAAPKKQTRKRPSKDAQIASLRRQTRWLWVIIIALLLALAVSLGRDVLIPDKGESGKNYIYIDPTD